jgi:RNA polymerase sigma factor (sigma-70 family)
LPDKTIIRGLFNKFSDITIIEGVRKQDDKILNWLYDNYFQTLRSYIFKNSGNEQDVSDVFQDTIIVLYNQIINDELELTTDLKGYFFGVARNIWGMQLRRIVRTTELITDIVDDEENDDTDNLLLGRVVTRAFEKLKPDQKQILKLYSDGLSYDDIALKMDFGSGDYAKRKKYLSKEALLDIMKEDPDYQEYLRFRK